MLRYNRYYSSVFKEISGLTLTFPQFVSKHLMFKKK